jgi:phenylacetate-CoA ligase
LSLLKKTIWKGYLLLIGETLKYLRDFDKAERLSGAELSSYQEERLKALLLHAHQNTAYYKKVLEESGVISGRRVRLENFSKTPFLNKEIIRTRFEELKSGDLFRRKWYGNTSGGSTGEPARFIQDRAYSDMSNAMAMLFDRWTGYEIAQRKIILWGSERDITRTKESAKRRLGNWLRSERFQNAYRMSPERMLGYAREINDFRPVQILAYAESLHELAKFIDEEKINMHSPRALLASAGTLFPDMRSKMERVFGVPVFNRYGSREVSHIACECEAHDGLHISAPTQFVEVLRDDGTPAPAGEPGEIVITNFANYAMPLIRYRIGDTGAMGKGDCPCGRSWPRLKEVRGRVTDNFITRTGARIYGAYFRHLLFYLDWIKKYQIMQEDYDFLRIRLVLSNGSRTPLAEHERDIKKIRSGVWQVMGPDCRVEFEFPEDIAPSGSGKYLYTICNLKALREIKKNAE